MTLGDRQDELKLSDAEFRMFSELLRRHCGLHFGSDARYLLEKRLARRLRALEVNSFASYHYRVRSAPAHDEELANLIDELTTNETYFFRERSQLHALIRRDLQRAPGGTSGGSHGGPSRSGRPDARAAKNPSAS